jgi:hypothetical protein
MKRSIANRVVLASLLFWGSHPTAGEGLFDRFLDPEDSRFDASQWLLDRQGFLPVPIIITEPAVGPGLGAALAFFHDDKETGREANTGTEGEQMRPPSISAVFGAATENGTWAAGAAHRGIWRDDRIRYLGALARADVVTDFFGALDQPRRFNADGWFLRQQALFRIGDSDFFLGGRIDYLSLDIGFDRDAGSELPPNQIGQTENAGIGLIGLFDGRDNTFTPNRGLKLDVEAIAHDGNFLGDFTYQKYRMAGQYYWDLRSTADLVVGLRLDARFARGDIPFYAVPFISLRGIPALRYQGENVWVAELEARRDIDARWSLVGFTGAGIAENVGDRRFGGGGDPRQTIGVGGRYLIARRLGLRVGFDVAAGPEETAFYVTIGSAWSF